MITTCQEEDREKADDGCADRGNDSRYDLTSRFPNDCQPVSRSARRAFFFPIGDSTVDILQDDNAHIDHRSNRDRDAGQRHDVGINAEQVHCNERHQNGQRQRQRDHKACANVEQEEYHHDNGNQRLLNQRLSQCANSFIDELCAVVDTRNFDAT